MFPVHQPPSALGFWIALEKCTASNGALSFLPGSHLTTRITKRVVRLTDNKGTSMVPLTSPSSDKVSSVQKGEYILEPCNLLRFGSVCPIRCTLLSATTLFVLVDTLAKLPSPRFFFLDMLLHPVPPQIYAHCPCVLTSPPRSST